MSFFDIAGIMDALRTSVGARVGTEEEDAWVGLDLSDKFQRDPIADQWIVAHGFDNFARDYFIFVDRVGVRPDDQQFILGRFRYQFTHCVWAEVRTALNGPAWMASWDDLFLDPEAWANAGQPEGYLWGANSIWASPGLKYLPGSPLSREWSERIGKPMNEVYIETNVHDINLVFHDVHVVRIARGNPITGELTPEDRWE